MRSLRHPRRNVPPRIQARLQGVVQLDLSAPGEVVSGRVRDAPDSLVVSARYDIEVHDRGLVIAPSADTGREIPSLVPWSELRGVSADRWTALSDGTGGQVLEFECADERWVDARPVRAFVVPAREVGPFLLAVAAGRRRRPTGTARPPGQGRRTPARDVRRPIARRHIRTRAPDRRFRRTVLSNGPPTRRAIPTTAPARGPRARCRRRVR